LASLDVSGQWHVFMQEPHLTEVTLMYAREKNLSTGESHSRRPGCCGDSGTPALGRDR
jgi:hypothetical protein